MTSHPKDLSDSLITAMKELPSLCEHLHLPFQSGSSRILKEMNRKYTKGHYLGLIDKVREAIRISRLLPILSSGFRVKPKKISGIPLMSWKKSVLIRHSLFCIQKNRNKGREA